MTKLLNLWLAHTINKDHGRLFWVCILYLSWSLTVYEDGWHASHESLSDLVLSHLFKWLLWQMFARPMNSTSTMIFYLTFSQAVFGFKPNQTITLLCEIVKYDHFKQCWETNYKMSWYKAQLDHIFFHLEPRCECYTALLNSIKHGFSKDREKGIEQVCCRQLAGDNASPESLHLKADGWWRGM